MMDLEDIEYAVYQQAGKLAVTLTLHAEASGNWGASGSDFGRQSMARWLCHIPADVACHPGNSYLSKLREAAQDHALPWTPHYLGETADPAIIASLEETIASFSFQIGDQKFSLQQGEELDLFLSEKGSNLIIIAGYHGTERNLILGRGTRDYKAPYIHIAMASEYLRSPSIVMPIVAMIGVHSITIRELAVETIFHDKWVAVANTVPRLSHAEKLGYAIKKKTLAAYGVSRLSAQHIAQIYSDFLSDMQCLLTAHEVGHGIIQHDRLPENTAILAESSQLLGDTILISLLELLADIAPDSSYGKGPILEIVSFATKTPERAERCFGLYLSDAYFYDTQTPHMMGYSHLILPVMAHLRPLQNGHPTWLAEAVAQTRLQQIADWAVDWVIRLTDVLGRYFALEIADVAATDPFTRYSQKGSLLYDTLTHHIQNNPTLIDEATSYLHKQAPFVYRSLYDILGYPEIDEHHPTAGVIKTVGPLFL
jgi:hypothetical protein